MNTSCSSSSSFSSSESEEEPEMEEKEKISLARVEPCLLCAETAIAYDLEGNIIKREPPSEFEEGKEDSEKRRNEQLFMFLCRAFRLKHQWGHDTYSHLSLHPFPFCESCEILLNSLANIYTKVEELEKVLQRKMKAAEQVYWENNLYDNQHRSYFHFRKDALRRVKGTRTPNEKREENGNQVEKKVKVVVRKESSRFLKRALDQSYVEEAFSSEEENATLPSNRKDGHVTISADPRPPPPPVCVTNQSSNSKPKPKKRKYLKRGNKIDNDNEQAKEESVKPRKIRLEDRRTGLIESDPITGSLSYTAGFGKHFGSMNGTIVFKPTQRKAGTNGYQCTNCDETTSSSLPLIQIHESQRYQRLLFRQHYAAFHSTRNKCRLCPQHLPSYSSRAELIQHLQVAHQILTMKCYEYAIIKKQKASGEEEEKQQERRAKGEQMKPQLIPPQPQPRSNQDEQLTGLFQCKFPSCRVVETLMEELALQSHIEREHGQSKAASEDRLCLVCGKVMGCAPSLRRHRTTHSGAKPHKCHLCPKSFALKSTLTLHLATNHGVGPQVLKCEQEGCDRLFINPLYLKKHMRDIHGIFTMVQKKKQEQK